MTDTHSVNNKRHKAGSISTTKPSRLKSVERTALETKEARQRFLSAIKDFFDSCMPTMVEGSNHVDSSYTRKPAFFDKHLDERLKLRKVVYQPALADNLKRIAVDSLKSYLKAYAGQDLPEPRDEAKHPFPGPQRRNTALDDSEINNCVNEAVVQCVYQTTIARHCNVVAATLELQLPSWRHCRGFLQWNIHPEKGHTQAVGDGFLRLVSESSIIPDLYHRAKNNFPRGVGVWEFKSLKAGAKDVFNAILAYTLLPEFPWERCEHGEVCHIQCEDKLKGFSGTWARTGPDADPPVCPLGSSDFELINEVHKDNMLKGRYILQQIWSEMVAVDATFACLNAGLYELILQRDRANKVLYLSSLIYTNAAEYAKMETGLFIAMLRDAKQRSLQIKNVRPLTWRDTPPLEKIQVSNSLNNDETQKMILVEAKSRKWLVMKPPRRGDTCFTFCRDSLYDRVDPITFKRSDEPPDFQADSRHFTVVAEPEKITSRGELSVDGVKFKGSSLWRFDRAYTKHANYEPESRKRLQWEAEVYHHLRNTGAADRVPSIIGLFRHANIEKDKKKPNGGYLTLVLEDVGSSLKALSHFIPAVKEECHRALNQIHAAGFCHGNISLEHIIYRGMKWPGNRISFVSFGRAIKGPDDARKKQEHEELDEVLSESSLKRKVAVE